MIAGIVTVLVILLSQAFYQPGAANKLSKKEQQTEKTDKHVSVAPSEVVPSPAVQLDKSTPGLLEILAPEVESEESTFPASDIAISFVKTFLRTAISPNAP